MTQLSPAAITRFRSKTQRAANGCLNWTGKLDNGYGRFWYEGRTMLAHRVAWEIENGPVPDGLHIDHLCRNRACVEVAHMEPVTIAENVLRGIGITAVNATKTVCKHGHALDQKNTYRRRGRGHRVCIRCARFRTQQWRMRQEAAA